MILIFTASLHATGEFLPEKVCLKMLRLIAANCCHYAGGWSSYGGTARHSHKVSTEPISGLVSGEAQRYTVIYIVIEREKERERERNFIKPKICPHSHEAYLA